MSLAQLTWNNSGAAYGGDPQNVIKCWSNLLTWVAKPKSPTLTWISWTSNTLPLLTLLTPPPPMWWRCPFLCNDDGSCLPFFEAGVAYFWAKKTFSAFRSRWMKCLSCCKKIKLICNHHLMVKYLCTYFLRNSTIAKSTTYFP